jgi:hypothetical protein
MTIVWIRQDIPNSKNKMWHCLHPDGVSLWCNRSVHVKMRRSQYALKAGDGRVCFKCNRYAEERGPIIERHDCWCGQPAPRHVSFCSEECKQMFVETCGSMDLSMEVD